MIYLFRKRNGSIIGTARESASSMMNTPNNFVTYQPEYLGAVSPLDFKSAMHKVAEEVPIEIQKLVKKDGEDTLITLDQMMISELIASGDKAIEARYQGLLKKRQAATHGILEKLAETADKTQKPTDYSKKLGAVEDVRGDVTQVIKGYV